MLIKIVLTMLVSFIISILTALVIIPILKKLKASQRLSIYLNETHRPKAGTPTMGGLIFIIGTMITITIFLLTGKINFSYSLGLIIFTFLSYAGIGFIDDFLIIKRNNNKGLSETEKLLMQIFIAIIFFYIFMINGNEPLLWVHTLGIKWHIGWFYGLFILFVLLSSSNAVNITDGLDGLAGGLSVIAFITFGIISLNTGWLDGYEDITIFAFSLASSLLAFLIFNTTPAKVFMGDTGSLALGASLGTFAILTRHELLLVVIGFVFLTETLTCVIQRIYYKFTKKRIFPITPIHHTFEKKGWKEKDIVVLFWIIGLICSMVAIIFGVLL